MNENQIEMIMHINLVLFIFKDYLTFIQNLIILTLVKNVQIISKKLVSILLKCYNL